MILAGQVLSLLSIVVLVEMVEMGIVVLVG
jgi:hypothetical protein